MKVARLLQSACAAIVLSGSLLLWPAPARADIVECTKVWILWSAIYFEKCETKPSPSVLNA